MIVYSKKIVSFIKEIKAAIETILTKEIKVLVQGDRFHYINASYPFKIVIFNHEKMLGYFDQDFCELGFHECLMQTSKQQLHNIIRHELAHYFTSIHFNNSVQAHGNEFRYFCQAMGWGEEVFRATTCLDDGSETLKLEESSILRKVQKLMALSASSNSYEAEQAMIKSQQILLNHNMEAKYIEKDNDEDKVILKRILKQTKVSEKTNTIARILQSFFVNAVYNRTPDYVYLEILGTAVNVEIAVYVATVLDVELDNLWNQARSNNADLKGIVAKNSFFLGIALGYLKKMESLKKEYSSETVRSLMIIEKKLDEAKAMAYSKLTSSKSRKQYCAESGALGEQAGRSLNIRSGLNNNTERSRECIDFQ